MSKEKLGVSSERPSRTSPLTRGRAKSSATATVESPRPSQAKVLSLPAAKARAPRSAASPRIGADARSSDGIAAGGTMLSPAKTTAANAEAPQASVKPRPPVPSQAVKA